MEKYNVTGMTCAACQAHVEKAVNSVDGVASCTVSLLTNTMSVTGSAGADAVIKAVEDAGYGASKMDAGSKGAGSAASTSLAAQEEALKDRTTPLLKKRLTVSVLFLLILMYFSMGVSMWGWPAPKAFADNMVAIGITEMLLAGIIMVINQKFFISGFKSLIHGAPNMDTLVAMGSGVSFAYSFVVLLQMSIAEMEMASDMNAMMVMLDKLMNELYFESAAMIVTLITVGKLLESLSKGRTTDALKGLLKLAPKTATLLRDGQEVTVGIEEVVKGDVFVVRPGESIPVDGIILEGNTSVNEAALTGESIPADKAEGDMVLAATINTSGFITCEAVRTAEDTTLSQIIQMVSDAASTKAPIARIADKVSGVFVPSVLLIAVLVFLLWLFLAASLPAALTRAIAVLVVSCPCALGLATPVAIMVGNGLAAKNGILFKTSASLEETGRVQIVALDKTGTITSGEPSVTDVIPMEGISKEELLSKAYSLEGKSEHPLAGAIISYGKENQVAAQSVINFKAEPGNGLTAEMDGCKLYGGNANYIKTIADIPPVLLARSGELSKEGKTPLFFASDETFLGIIAVADTIKEDSAAAVKMLHTMGIRVVMLTGDNKVTAEAIGRQAGVDEVIAGVLPDGKEAVIRKLMEKGRTAMVGDGINDAPALTRADIGIAIGAGTDIAIDAADVVLMKSSLLDVPAAIRLSRKTLRNIHENLFWAFIYNILLIPVAAGAYVHFGLSMNPMFGAAAMSLSSFTVCMNALRINLFNPQDASKDHRIANPLLQNADDNRISTKENTMTKTINIEGMMCGHCEATVQKALEGLDGVDSAAVSHESGTAVVTLSAEVADDVLKKAVEDKDYKVTSIG